MFRSLLPLPTTLPAALPAFDRGIWLSIVRAMVLSWTLTCAVILLRSSDALPGAIPPLLYMALQFLSLLGLLTALICAGPGRSDADKLLRLLNSLEGLGLPDSRLHWFITARCLARVLILPAIILVLAANTGYPARQLVQTLGFALGALLYAAFITLTLASLTWFARKLSPTRGRWLLAGVTLAPAMLSHVWTTLPNPIRASRHLIEMCLAPFA